MGRAFLDAHSHIDYLINPTPHDTTSLHKYPQSKIFSPTDHSTNDIHVMCVSSHGMEWFLENMSLVSNPKILILTKALISTENGIVTVSQALKNRLPECQVIFTSGPCLASDLNQQKNVFVNFSSNDFPQESGQSLADIVNLFQNGYYHITVCHDIIGCEWLAALKNIYAIVCAYAHTISTSFGAAVFQMSLSEMQLWLEHVHADPKTVLSLSGVGDLSVTMLGGRNGKFGRFLSQGLAPKEILQQQMKDTTVEGVNMILKLNSDSHFASKRYDNLKLFHFISRIIKNNTILKHEQLLSVVTLQS